MVNLREKRIDVNSIIPLYYQIKEILQDLIESGELRENEAMPSERELAETYGVNRLTVRQAVLELVNEGLLYRKKGIGTFVARPKIKQELDEILSFTEKMQKAGKKSKTTVLSIEDIPATKAIAKRLNIPEGDIVTRAIRLRFVEDEPVIIENTHIPKRICPDLISQDLEKNSLYRILSDRYGIVIQEVRETLEPVILRDVEADLLETEEGSPSILREVTAYTSDGTPIEYNKSIVRGDRCKYYFHVVKK